MSESGWSPIFAKQVKSTDRCRWLLALLTLISTGAAVWLYTNVVAANGLNFAEFLLIPLFGFLFFWIAFSFWSATLGLFVILFQPSENRERSTERLQTPVTQTAILMPVYNECPSRVFAGVQAMCHSLLSTGQAANFDFFILSDTTSPDVWLEEERTWQRLIAELGDSPRVFYRRRPHNTSRKSGNIADFCTRWGAQYQFMIVMDADSVMEGETLVEMVRRMEDDPQLGILQVPPTPVNNHSFFARLQQFSSRFYSPLFVKGFAQWARSQGNYWGHNAIIRVESFMNHCDLPVLPGKAPLGGEILSHDFVEAALMSRAGWKVQIADDLDGSYEECPTTLLDYAKRDQRWCQGNLQHMRLVISEGFRPVSRLHFLMGIMAYMSSPLWLTFMLLSVVALLLDGPANITQSQAFGAFSIFVLTMCLLLLPKLWCLIALTKQSKRLKEFGGWDNVISSVVLETLMSILIAPIMMVFHTRFVVSTLRGERVQWNAQNRGEGETDLAAALMVYGIHTTSGLIMGLILFLVAPSLLLWFSPVLLGLLLAVPISLILESVQAGERLAQQGLLLIPEEIFPPRLLRAQEEFYKSHQLANEQMDRSLLFDYVLLDPAFHALHRNILQATESHVTIPEAELARIRKTIEQQGSIALSTEARRMILSDAAALKDLHVHLRSEIGVRPPLSSS